MSARPPLVIVSNSELIVFSLQLRLTLTPYYHLINSESTRVYPSLTRLLTCCAVPDVAVA